MKKILYLLLALPFVGLTACNNDEELPNVTLQIETEGATEVDNVYYVIQGDVFEITSLTAVPVRQGAKASVANVFYTLDGRPYGASPIAPFGQKFDTTNLVTGTHKIGATMNVFEEGCTPAEAWMGFELVVVSNEDEIPFNPDQGTTTQGNTINVVPSIQS